MTALSPNIHVHQIFYNEVTRAALDPAYMPLDNSNSPQSDWYEFWPIRNFLHANELIRNHWYGFLSPKFFKKTGISASALNHIISKLPDTTSVLLLSPSWSQLAYFRNVFEQGEFFHPKLLIASQAFVAHTGIRIDLSKFVTHTKSSVFSNFVIAKPAYWKLWLALADRLFDYAESGVSEIASSNTNYGQQSVPMKVFIQERLSALVLATREFDVATLDYSKRESLGSGMIFEDTPDNQRALVVMDYLKTRYTSTLDQEYMNVFDKIRPTVQLLPGYGSKLPWQRNHAG